MGWYNTATKSYYEGDRINISDQEVPTRPSPGLVWLNGSWQADPAEMAVSLKKQALDLLSETDLVAARCFKAGIAYPDEWKAYTSDLRLVVNGDLTALPVKPDFPNEAEPYEPPVA